MVALNRQIIDKFFDRVEAKIVKTQTKIASHALDTLFRKSPHAGENQAKGEYDANHKISINHAGHSSHHGPTHNEAASRMFITTEKAKLSAIKFGDSITVLNDTGHAIDVEIGMQQPGNTWKKRGYYPFRKTRVDLKRKYNNVLK